MLRGRATHGSKITHPCRVIDHEDLLAYKPGKDYSLRRTVFVVNSSAFLSDHSEQRALGLGFIRYAGCQVHSPEVRMKSTKRTFVILAALAVLFIASAQASPQSQGAQPSAPAQSALAQSAAPLSAEGELVDVDTKGNMITIKTTTAPEMKFKYDDTTKVTGGQKGVAGLATMKGSQITVQYKKDGAANTATNITVKSAAGATSPRPELPRAPEVPPSPEKPRQ